MTARTNNDPRINFVVFDIGTAANTTTKVHAVETRSENGIETAWRAVAGEGMEASKVVRLFSEWQPTPSDQAFITTHFPGVALTHSFPRPEQEEGWEAAFAEAAAAMEKAQQTMPDALDDDAILLLPVLRDAGPKGVNEALSDAMFIMTHGAGLASALADVQRKEDGAVGIHYLLRANVADETLNERLKTLGNNVAHHLQIEGGELENGERLISITHALHHGSSVLMLPDFHAQACGWLDCPTIFVGLINPDQLMITNAEHSAARTEITRMVLESNYMGSVPLTPATFELSSEGLVRIESRPEPV